MENEDWIQSIENWRKLPAEERRRRHQESIPRRVANSMAMEGEPVDEECIRKRLAHLIYKDKGTTPDSDS